MDPLGTYFQLVVLYYTHLQLYGHSEDRTLPKFLFIRSQITSKATHYFHTW